MGTSFSTGDYVASEGFAGCFSRHAKAAARRGVLIHGGRAQTCLSNLPPDTTVNALNDDSIPVAFADYSDGKTWGNDTGSTRVGQAWTYQKSAFGAKTDKVCLYGVSMGSLVMLRWALANVSSVACYVGLIPALSLVDLHDNDRGGNKAEIETAHGTGVVSSYVGNSTITARDPLQNAASYTFPILLVTSSNDPVCVPQTATDFAAAAPNVTRIDMGALGHGTAGAPVDTPNQIAGFFAAYA